jgi:hypothetical protein
MALIWIFDKKESKHAMPTSKPVLPQLVFFLLTIVILAYLEEGIWDGLIWREHTDIFSMFRFLPVITSKEMLTILVPLLSLPQATHYVLDGFIWRKQKEAQ